MYYVKMIGLYLRENLVAYFRKSGDSGFGFTSRKELASTLTKEECDDIIKNKDWYCSQFTAIDLVIEEA